MASERNPQRDQMADASMVRNLAFQARALWPQEARLLGRYRLPAAPRVLDLGCGTGEIASRLADAVPAARVVGVDLLEGHLALARARYGRLASRLSFARGDGFALAFPDGAFDLAVCRHVLQSVPEPERVVAEMARVVRPGGWVHLLLEDYGLLHASPASGALERFWQQVPRAFGDAVGTDMFVGRRGFALLRGAGLEEIGHEDLVVDTLRVSRDVFAGIIEAWRDGFSAAITEHTGLAPEEVRDRWEELLSVIRDPAGYAVWRVPVWSGRVPPR
jgi:ubiquinone/menaquinone biosynthesis C-methylase UbiE